MATQNPQRIELGKLLEGHRRHAALQTAAVEQELGWYPGKVSRVEGGKRVPVRAEVDRLADIYKITPDERSTLHSVADAARKRSAPSRVADFAQTYVSLEQAAVEIKYYDAELLHGLAQTEGYARALLAHADVEDGDAWVADRLSRATLLTQPRAPSITLVLGEAALHRRVGSETTMREQLRHLLQLMELPNVTVRVLPYSAGAHRALGVGFTYLRLDSPAIKRVYLEGLTDAAYVHEPAEVAVYEDGFEQINAVALDDGESANILRRRIDQ